MTQSLFPIGCVFIVFVGLFFFCLFSINYWNFQREWMHINVSVLNRTMSAMQLLKAHFIPLTCQRLETTKHILFMSVRYSSCICLLQFVSTLFPLDLAIIWQIDVAVQNKHIARSCKKQFNGRQWSWNHHFKLISKSTSLQFAKQSFLLSVLETSFILVAIWFNFKVSHQYCKSNSYMKVAKTALI